MGALKCLSDCLPPGALNAFDMYFGISAGAVLDRDPRQRLLRRRVHGRRSRGTGAERIPKVDLSPPEGLAPEPREPRDAVRERLPGARRRPSRTSSAARRALRSRPSSSTTATSSRAPFSADGYEAMLRYLFTRPGATNDFRKLRRPLYVGATDQDAREHVLFGERGLRRRADQPRHPGLAQHQPGVRVDEDRRPLLRRRGGDADLQLHRGDPEGLRPDLRPGPARPVRLEGSRRLREPPRPPLQRRPGHPDRLLSRASRRRAAGS